MNAKSYVVYRKVCEPDQWLRTEGRSRTGPLYKEELAPLRDHSQGEVAGDETGATKSTAPVGESQQ